MRPTAGYPRFSGWNVDFPGLSKGIECVNDEVKVMLNKTLVAPFKIMLEGPEESHQKSQAVWFRGRN
jgi:hypothetical protein